MTKDQPVSVRKRDRVFRIARIVFGSILLVIGVLAIPYPGPGWLIVFTALAILAQDFEWAQRLLDYAKGKYDAWQDWLRAQPVYVKALFWTLTFIVVVLTIYLLNGYGLINQWLNLRLDWLNSPLPIFN